VPIYVDGVGNQSPRRTLLRNEIDTIRVGSGGRRQASQLSEMECDEVDFEGRVEVKCWMRLWLLPEFPWRSEIGDLELE